MNALPSQLTLALRGLDTTGSFRASLLGRVVMTMCDLLADPAAMPDQVLRRHRIAPTVHAFDLNLLWLWSEPVEAFLNTVATFDAPLRAAKAGLSSDYLSALSCLSRRSMVQVMTDLRDAFREPPGAMAIEKIGRTVLADLPPSARGLLGDLASFKADQPSCRLDLWLEELGWKELIAEARRCDQAVRALIVGQIGSTWSTIQHEARRVAA
jgi:hypothetical protein